MYIRPLATKQADAGPLMPQVEFHILSEAGDVARLRHACQLTEKAYEQGQRVYVLTADDAEAQRLDEMLWTFRDQAFIPHEVISPSSPTHPRIMAVIGATEPPPEGFQALLINMSNTLPVSVDVFARICEVVDADPQRKQQARDRFKQYRDRGDQLQTINQ
jgi:DNA polymerase-3 subunit chi